MKRMIRSKAIYRTSKFNRADVRGKPINFPCRPCIIERASVSTRACGDLQNRKTLYIKYFTMSFCARPTRLDCDVFTPVFEKNQINRLRRAPDPDIWDPSIRILVFTMPLIRLERCREVISFLIHYRFINGPDAEVSGLKNIWRRGKVRTEAG